MKPRASLVIALPLASLLIASTLLEKKLEKAVERGLASAPKTFSANFSLPFDHGELRVAGKGYSRMQAGSGVREVYLEGSPEELGQEQIQLNYDHILAAEKELWDSFADLIPYRV